MRKLVFFSIFLVLWAHAAAGDESIITIDVKESGNALWTMEKRIPLDPSAMIQWEKAGQNISKPSYTADFKDMSNLFLRSAQNFSNRSMEVEEFNISYDTVKTMSGGFGIIRYTFLWKNFSRTDSDKIYIGDAFPEGTVFSTDNTLIITIPDGYDVNSSSPNFDRREGNRLIWEGSLYHSFARGEPALVLSRTVIAQDTGAARGIWPVAVVSLIILISGTSVIFWRTRRKYRTGQISSEAYSKDTLYKAGNDAVQIDSSDAIPTNSMNMQPDATPLPEDLGDEEMIEQYLLKSGGQAYQSDIVREIGFSKSKISIVLAKMRDDGKILKIRKGKENIIRMAKK